MLLLRLLLLLLPLLLFCPRQPKTNGGENIGVPHSPYDDRAAGVQDAVDAFRVHPLSLPRDHGSGRGMEHRLLPLRLSEGHHAFRGDAPHRLGVVADQAVPPRAG